MTTMTATTTHEAPVTESAVEADVKINSLPDLIRLGSMTTVQSVGWGEKEGEACALSCAGIAAEQMGLI